MVKSGKSRVKKVSPVSLNDSVESPKKVFNPKIVEKQLWVSEQEIENMKKYLSGDDLQDWISLQNAEREAEEEIKKLKELQKQKAEINKIKMAELKLKVEEQKKAEEEAEKQKLLVIYEKDLEEYNNIKSSAETNTINNFKEHLQNQDGKIKKMTKKEEELISIFFKWSFGGENPPPSLNDDKYHIKKKKSVSKKSSNKKVSQKPSQPKLPPAGLDKILGENVCGGKSWNDDGVCVPCQGSVLGDSCLCKKHSKEYDKDPRLRCGWWNITGQKSNSWDKYGKGHISWSEKQYFWENDSIIDNRDEAVKAEHPINFEELNQ